MSELAILYVVIGLLGFGIALILAPYIYKFMKTIFKRASFQSLGESSKIRVVHQLNEAIKILSADKTGAIITIQMKDELDSYRTDGIFINANISASLIISIFNKKAPIHDGAIIIKNDKISYVATYYKITNRSIDNKYGARHRAALGIAEATDALTIVVSEETGNVSITHTGKIKSVNLKSFQESLLEYLK